MLPGPHHRRLLKKNKAWLAAGPGIGIYPDVYVSIEIAADTNPHLTAHTNFQPGQQPPGTPEGEQSRRPGMNLQWQRSMPCLFIELV